MIAPASVSKAVTNILAVADAVVAQRFRAVGAIARACGIPKTSGYRLLEAMEARGYLAKDVTGAFVRGPEAARIGLSAWGFGHLYLLCEPVLHQLRHEARNTAFLGVHADGELWIGPFSIGRRADHAMPPVNAVYRCESYAAPADLSPVGIYPKDTDGPAGTAHTAIVARLRTGDDGAIAVIGILSRNSTAADSEAVHNAINAAKQRMLDAL